ncbi:rap guanine nucleotide exchange factor 1-like [Cheilinus undulatus]|uniref:rap guanine nucleotide exchange factor 1-like n=1 Tax=Cheilinus undulatus TaxID=241271 RepID=UPI001BD5C6FB|nr:rap guanine nucleotide exchange factor 1-like [Cheilinus undulatus]
MSSRGDSKTASQFVSLTLKLKGKIQSQTVRRFERIKPSPTLKVKPPDLNLEQHQIVQHKAVSGLADQERAVVSSLQYFKALVDSLGMDKMVQDQSVVGRLLGGASGGVLEAVQTLVQLEPHLHKSKTISSCLARLYQSVAELVQWVDKVMFQGVARDNKESKESVTKVIRAVLDGVKELVRLASERQEGSTPLSPVQSQADVDLPDGLDSTLKSGRTSTCQSPGAPAKEDEEWVNSERSEELIVLAPPKPPMPFQEPLVMPPLGLSPPALPPKKRQSLPGSTSCKVAIVVPMRREPEVKSQFQWEEEYSKRCSSSSADSSAEKTHSEEDPDYEFLHTDLSSSETLPPLPTPASLPPALPEKRRRSTAGNTNSQTSSSFGFDSAVPEQSSSHPDDLTAPDETLSSPLYPSKMPPPLPEKKRHIDQYLKVFESYSGQSPANFYQPPLTVSERYSSRQREVETTYQLTHLDAHLEMCIPDSTPSPELLPVPILPPKKKQQDTAETNCQHGDHQPRDRSQSLQQEEEHCQRSTEELKNTEEVLLTDLQQIRQRITMKNEEEEGPDVKAASPDILLVYATETDRSNDQGLYREAFLSTYRSFISPNEVIHKLQGRYRHFCKGCEPADLTAAKKTFHLLIRVVDELCAIELEPDLLLLLMDLVFMLLIGGELGPAHLLRSNILSKMEQRWQLIGSPQSLRPLAARGVAARPGTLLDFRSQDLAEQLTLLDSALFYKIELPEVLLWSKEQNEERSPNLTQFTQHFNNVSYWVRSVIILQDKPQDREKLFLKFLKIMKHLRKLNNFNSYLSILSALDSAPLRRLDWQRSTAEALEEYSSLIDSSSSFRAYRAALAEVDPPCIPYLGLILQDLTFVHLGNPDTLVLSQGSGVNFSKRWQQFNILDTLRTYQQAHYSLQPNDEIISFFNDFSDHLAEEALWELSLRLRPRNAPRVNQR